MRCFCPLPYYILIEEKDKNMGKRKSATFENDLRTFSFTSYTLLYDVYFGVIPASSLIFLHFFLPFSQFTQNVFWP